MKVTVFATNTVRVAETPSCPSHRRRQLRVSAAFRHLADHSPLTFGIQAADIPAFLCRPPQTPISQLVWLTTAPSATFTIATNPPD